MRAIVIVLESRALCVQFAATDDGVGNWCREVGDCGMHQ